MILRGATKAWRQRILEDLVGLNLALYQPTISLSALMNQAYTPAGEIAESGSYAAGGVALSYTINDSSDTPFLVIEDPTIEGMSQQFRGGLIYSPALSNLAVYVIDFGLQSPGGLNTTIQFPPARPDRALIRVSG